MISIGFSGLRQRFNKLASYFGARSGAGGFNEAARRFMPTRNGISRWENCIISLMEKARLSGLMLFRFVDGLCVRLFDFLFAIRHTQRTDQFAVI
jgi:hypothetical protein